MRFNLSFSNNLLTSLTAGKEKLDGLKASTSFEASYAGDDEDGYMSWIARKKVIETMVLRR